MIERIESAKRRGSGGKAPRTFFEYTPFILAWNTSPDPMFAGSKKIFCHFVTSCFPKLASSG